MGLVHINIHLNMGRPFCYNAVVGMNSDRLKGSKV